MYCPICFNNSILIADKGVINVIINNRQMDAGRFLFNSRVESRDQLIKHFKQKVEEFFQWYASFQNPQTITKVILSSNSLICSKHCKIPASMKCDVTNLIFTQAEILKVLTELSNKYSIRVDLEENI